MPWYLGNSRPFTYFFRGTWGIFLPLIIIWSVIWTGLALWHAARRADKWWFILFMLVHTAGILEIVYLLFVVRAFEQKPVVRDQKKNK